MMFLVSFCCLHQFCPILFHLDVSLCYICFPYDALPCHSCAACIYVFICLYHPHEISLALIFMCVLYIVQCHVHFLLVFHVPLSHFWHTGICMDPWRCLLKGEMCRIKWINCIWWSHIVFIVMDTCLPVIVGREDHDTAVKNIEGPFPRWSEVGFCSEGVRKIRAGNICHSS